MFLSDRYCGNQSRLANSVETQRTRSGCGEIKITGRPALSEANGMPVPHPTHGLALQAWITGFPGTTRECPARAFERGKALEKNREMKEGPTILLIIKDRFSEPTMFMKSKLLSSAGHDVYEAK